MMIRLSLLLSLAASSLAVPLAHAAPGDEQGSARKELRAGKILRLDDIERRVLPTMPGMEYRGQAFDDVAMVYRLRFIRGDRMYYVDVDARTGQIIARH